MKPIARVVGYHAGRCVIEPTNPADVLPTGMALFDAAPKVVQEPVAWAATSEDGVVEALGFNQSKNRFVVPLYKLPEGD